jgi:accessory gene regulator B
MNEISIHKIGQALGTYVAKKVARTDQTEFLAYGAEILVGVLLSCAFFFPLRSSWILPLKLLYCL